MNGIQNERIKWIDYAKAFAIIFVVIGHVDTGNYFTGWIYSFHMPLFFFLSGITMKANREGSEHVIKLSRSILVPYFLYSLLYLTYNTLQNIILYKNTNLIAGFLGIFIQMRGTDYSLGLWFLPLLFISEIFVYFIICQKNSIQWFVMALFCFIGFQYAIFVHTPLPWAIDAVPFASLYIWLGYRYKNEVPITAPIDGLKKIHSYLPYTVLVGSAFMSVFCGRLNVVCAGQSVDMHRMIYGNLFLYIIAGISGTLTVLLICQIIFDRYKSNILSYIGKNTLHIYCLHGLVLSVIKKGIEIKEGMKEFYCSSIYPQILIALVVVLLCVLLIKTVELIKSRVTNRSNTNTAS